MRPYTIDFTIYRLHNVGYIWKQEGTLQVDLIDIYS